jgi:hypothetical protein
MNKRAQIGETMTWFVAFVVIFFIMVLFVSFSITLAGKRSISKAEIGSSPNILIGPSEEFIGFLNGKIDFKGKIVSMKELVIFEGEDALEKQILFGKSAKEFLSSISSKIKNGEDYACVKSWVRVFDISTQVDAGGQIFSLLNVDSNDPSCRDSTLCSANKENTFSYISSNKKIALCLEAK